MAEVLGFPSFLFHDSRDRPPANGPHFFIIDGSIQLGDIAVGIIQQILQILMLIGITECRLPKGKYKKMK